MVKHITNRSFCWISAIFLVPATTVPAQDAVLDSMRAVIAQLAEDDTLRIRKHIGLAFMAYDRGKPDVAHEAIDLAMQEAEKQGRPFGRAIAIFTRGLVRNWEGDPAGAIEDLEKAAAIFKQLGDTRAYARSLLKIGEASETAGRYDDASNALNAAEPLFAALKDSSNLHDVWLQRGNVCHSKGMMPEAAGYFSRSLEYSERIRDRLGIALGLMNLANTFPDSEREKAIEYYRRSDAIFQQLGDQGSRAIALNNLGLRLGESKETRGEARQVFELAYHLAQSNQNALRKKIMSALISLYMYFGENELADRMQAALRTLTVTGKKPLEAALSRLVDAQKLLYEGKIQEILPVLLEARDLAEQSEDKTFLARVYRELASCYAVLDDSARAYVAYKLYIKLEKDYAGIEVQKHIGSLAAKYDAVNRENRITMLEQEKQIQALSLQRRNDELVQQRLIADERKKAIRLLSQEKIIRDLELGRNVSELALQKARGEKREKEVSLLRTNRQLQASVIERQTSVQYSLIAGFVLLAIIAFLTVRRVQGKRREASLRAEAAEAESLRVAAAGAHREQIAQQTFTRRLIQSQEQERQRIAQELHDSLSQSLLVIRNRALVGMRADGMHGKIAEQFAAISDLSAQSVEEVRAISRALRPSQLDRLGLTTAMRAALTAVAESSEVRFSIDIDDVDHLFAPENEIAVFRLLQEGVNNILKHAAAGEALVAVSRHDGTVRITIEDNGRGYDSHADGNGGSSGLGLRGMEERVRMLGGTWSVRTAPGQGTAISIDLPAAGDGNSATPSVLNEVPLHEE